MKKLLQLREQQMGNEKRTTEEIESDNDARGKA